MEKVQITIERVIYENNGFYIVEAKKGRELIKAKGSFPSASKGDVFCIEGEWKENKKYGPSFDAKLFYPVVPTSESGMIKYIAGRKIKGIGEYMASRIVKKFGKDAIRIMEEEPEKLLAIPGIGKRRVAAMKKSGADKRASAALSLFLAKHGLNPALAEKITRYYSGKKTPVEILELVKTKPYDLTEIPGLSFFKVDDIALHLGIEETAMPRLRAGIRYALESSQVEGHCYLTRERLMQEALKLLKIRSVNLISRAIAEMEADGGLIIDHNGIYLPGMYWAESRVARALMALSAAKPSLTQTEEAALKRAFEAEEKKGTRFDAKQKEAITQSFLAKLLVVTGGPGTGKTTTCRTIVNAHRMAGTKTILLAAPTGRAAKRMEEAIGLSASTIHRLLCYQGGGFGYNKENPLSGELLIVDESSMIDLKLMDALLSAVPKSMHVIFVGDKDQLPSVGAGNVLRDMIESDIPVVKLDTVHRQDDHNLIVDNAHAINAGRVESMIFRNSDPDAGFYFSRLKESSAEQARDMIVNLVTEYMPKRYPELRTEDIQVLAPMKNGLCGVNELNRVLQEKLNPDGRGKKVGDVEFRKNDRVMQIRNNYSLPDVTEDVGPDDEYPTRAVFNGDTGRISEIDFEEECLVVDYGDNVRVLYEFDQLNQLTLAYACTVHKSQGSEYPVVVMPIINGHHIMLQRNLFYTGVTRAKRAVYIIGEWDACQYAVRNAYVQHRNTMLRERISDCS